MLNPVGVSVTASLAAATGEVKAELIALLTDIVGRHQKARSQVTEEIVDAFMAVRPMHAAVKSR